MHTPEVGLRAGELYVGVLGLWGRSCLRRGCNVSASFARALGCSVSLWGFSALLLEEVDPKLSPNWLQNSPNLASAGANALPSPRAATTLLQGQGREGRGHKSAELGGNASTLRQEVPKCPDTAAAAADPTP